MKQLLIQIPKELLSPSEMAHFEGELSIPEIRKGEDIYRFAEPIRWEADITNTGGALLVDGVARGAAETQCARCLEPAYVDIEGDIEGYFLISPESVAQAELEELDYELLPDDKRIDFSPLIEAAILLELPLVPICSEDCKGLCSRCGANLNMGECDCGNDEDIQLGANNPFGVLAGLNLD